MRLVTAHGSDDHERRADLVDPWWDLRCSGQTEEELRQACHAELLIEVSAGHPLHGRTVTVIAKSNASDDITVAGQGWAHVHLTWKRAAKSPSWPTTKIYNDVEALERWLHESN